MHGAGGERLYIVVATAINLVEAFNSRPPRETGPA